MRKNNYIREAMESELEYDPLVDAANITVKVMSGNEHYSKPHVIEKKKSPLAASNASR